MNALKVIGLGDYAANRHGNVAAVQRLSEFIAVTAKQLETEAPTR